MNIDDTIEIFDLFELNHDYIRKTLFLNSFNNFLNLHKLSFNQVYIYNT
jgi:hypothetical protein